MFSVDGRATYDENRLYPVKLPVGPFRSRSEAADWIELLDIEWGLVYISHAERGDELYSITDEIMRYGMYLSGKFRKHVHHSMLGKGSDR